MTKILSNLADVRELLEASQAEPAAHLRQAQKAESERDKLVGIVAEFAEWVEASAPADVLKLKSEAERLLAEIRGGGGKS